MDTMPVPQGLPSEPDAVSNAFSPRERRRRDLIATAIILALTLSVVLTFVVLNAMASASASVTGGCGGG